VVAPHDHASGGHVAPVTPWPVPLAVTLVCDRNRWPGVTTGGTVATGPARSTLAWSSSSAAGPSGGVILAMLCSHLLRRLGVGSQV